MEQNNEERQRTQKQEVKKHLIRFGNITPMTALAKYGCFRLASVINRLRNDGCNIKTEIRHGFHYATYTYKAIESV